MKYIFLLLAIIFLFIPVCKKDNKNEIKPVNKNNEKETALHKLMNYENGEFILNSASFKKENNNSSREERTLTFSGKYSDVELSIKEWENNELSRHHYTGRYELKNDDIFITFEYEIIHKDASKSAGDQTTEPTEKNEVNDFTLTLYWQESLNGYLTEEQLKYINNKDEYTHNKNWHYFADKNNDDPAKAKTEVSEYYEDGYYH
jgi:hypothetical protein